MVKRINAAILGDSEKILSDLIQLGCSHVHEGEDAEQVLISSFIELIEQFLDQIFRLLRRKIWSIMCRYLA